jgi:tryptophanase
MNDNDRQPPEPTFFLAAARFSHAAYWVSDQRRNRYRHMTIQQDGR